MLEAGPSFLQLGLPCLPGQFSDGGVEGGRGDLSRRTNMGAPGWLSRLSLRLLFSVEVMSSGL